MEDGQTPFGNWVKTNASTANMLSIIMLIFAAWAAVEIVTNVTGNEIPPVTGMETNSDADDTQRTNNGAIIGLGAVAGTMGLVLQLLIPREESDEVIELMPDEDEEIDEVVDVMMEDIESEDEDESEDSTDESEESDSDDEGDSFEEGDEVAEDEGEDSQAEEAPEEEEKTPVKKRKF